MTVPFPLDDILVISCDKLDKEESKKTILNFKLTEEQVEKINSTKVDDEHRLRLILMFNKGHSNGIYVADSGKIPICNPHMPFDITDNLPLNTSETEIVVRWEDEILEVSLCLCTKTDSVSALEKLQNAQELHANKTWEIIQNKLKMQNEECDIEIVDLIGVLVCPLGKMKMKFPCRSNTCTHFQCFDAEHFLKMNYVSPKWFCPICFQPIKYDDLQMDALFMQILKETTAECTEVRLFSDCTWKPVDKKKDMKAQPIVITILENSTWETFPDGTSFVTLDDRPPLKLSENQDVEVVDLVEDELVKSMENASIS